MIIVNIMIKIITMIITATITILKGNNEDYYQHSCCSAVSYDEQNARVSVVYNDHSLYIWDVRDIRKVRLLLQNSYFSSFLIITVFLEMLLGKYFSFVYAGKQVFVFSIVSLTAAGNEKRYLTFVLSLL